MCRPICEPAGFSNGTDGCRIVASYLLESAEVVFSQKQCCGFVHFLDIELIPHPV